MNTLPIFLDNWVLRSKWCAYVTSDNSTGNLVRKGSIWKWLEARLWETQTFIHCISNVWNVVLLYSLLIWLWLHSSYVVLLEKNQFYIPILHVTAKRKLERLQFSTSSSFVRIWSACSSEFKTYFWTFWALYHLLFDLETIGAN